MSDLIEVSAYCTAYNHEKYIRQTLEGFVAQKTTFKYEVIVHDDASTDSTADIIREYAVKYPEIIKPIFQTENQYSRGVNIAEKFIYPIMKGKYIAICEGDDYWNNEYKLQKQYDILEAHPECSMAVHKVICCNEDGTPHEQVFPAPGYQMTESRIVEPEEMAKCLWQRGGYPFHTSSFFYRKDARTRYSIDKESWVRRDLGMMRACMLHGAIYYLDEVMSTRRLGSVDGWNQRLKRSGTEGRIKISVFDSNAELSYDKYSGYKYHDLIIRAVFRRMLGVALYAPEQTRAFFKENELSWSVVKDVVSMKEKIEYGILYFLLLYCPGVLKIIGRIRRV